MSVSYKPYIDGLRAVAVLPVVAFHAGVAAFGGGYIGVDVFFVISGFLITSILWREMADGAFSFRGFYVRRAKRILPALYTVLGATMAAGFLLLPPFELRKLAESTLSVLAFGSNIYFWSQSGYFGPAAEQLPLLHTWSVSVEEQFYLLFPALLVAIRRLARGFTFLVVGVLTLATFILSGLVSPLFPVASFYLLPTRAWELLLGAGLALAPAVKAPRFAAECGLVIGVAMIGAAVFVLDADANTPGWAAVAPCLGAALVLACGGGARSARVMLDNPIAVGIGRISYSLYLWHWPLLIFMPAQLGERGEFSPAVLAAYFAVLVVLSAFSYFVIEQPFRRGLQFKFPIKPLAWGVAASALLAVSIAGVVSHGFPQRLSPLSQRLAAYAEYRSATRANFRGCFVSRDRGLPAYDAANCIKSGAEPSILVWGDSVAAYQMHGWRKAAAARGFSVSEATMSSCRPSLSEDRHPNCVAFNRFVLDVIRDTRPSVVVLSARWNMGEPDPGSRAPTVEDVVGLLQALRREGVRVVVVGPPVQYTEPLPAVLIQSQLVNFEGFDTAPYLDSWAEAFDRSLHDALRATPDIPYVSVYDRLCRGRRCRVMSGGEIVTWDRHHMTDAGAEYLAEQVFPLIERQARAP